MPPILALDPSTTQLWGSILAAVAAVGVGVLTAASTFRTSQRSAAQAEAQRIGERGDKQYAALEVQCERMKALLDEAETERDLYRKERDVALEDYHRLRLRVLRAGFDPDQLAPRETP